jgi:hypothetical protein
MKYGRSHCKVCGKRLWPWQKTEGAYLMEGLVRWHAWEDDNPALATYLRAEGVLDRWMLR